MVMSLSQYPDWVVNIMKSILKIPIGFLRYFSLGLFITIYLCFKIIATLFSYIFKGFMAIALACYQFIKLVFKGLAVPFTMIHNASVKQYERNKAKNQKNEALLAAKRREREIAEARLAIENKQRVEEMKRREAIEEKNRKRLAKAEEGYVNDSIKIEKRSFGDQLSDFIDKVAAVPKKAWQKVVQVLDIDQIKKNKENEALLKREALLINYSGADAVKADKKIIFEYTGKTADGKYVRDYFSAYSKVEVHSFLLSEGMEVYSIRTDKWIRLLHAYDMNVSTKFKNKDLIFFLTQLSTYIKSGIPLVDSLKTLSRQYRNKGYHRVFRSLIYNLAMGDSFSVALEKQGQSFPQLLINMIKTSEMTGSLPEVLDDMADYYTETEKTRKAMLSAMLYPIIILVVSVAVLVFVMVWVIPQFVAIFESMDAAQIPAITQFVLNVSNYLKTNWLSLIITIVVVVITFMWLYKNVRAFRRFIQWFLMHIPVVKDIIIDNEVTMFTKTFASLLEHNVYITDSMDILNKITNNEIYKGMITSTMANLAKGDKISKAFEGQWAFPIPAYEMLVTGEKTGELPQMMKKVSDYYQDLHRNTVQRVKILVEPVLIILLTFVVGVIMLSVVIPMFQMYDLVQQQ